MRSCILRSEYRPQIERLGRQLSLDQSDYLKNQENYENIAYALLVCNNGNGVEYDTNGLPSTLYADILSDCGGNEREAILRKSYIYTRQFAEDNGEWLDKTDERGNPLQEPSYDTVKWRSMPAADKFLVEEYGDDMRKYFSDVSLESALTNSTAFNNSIRDSIEDEVWSYNPENRQEYLETKKKVVKNRVNKVLTDVLKGFEEMWGIKVSDVTDNKLDKYKGDKNILRFNIMKMLYESANDPFRHRMLGIVLVQAMNGVTGRSLLPSVIDVYLDCIKNTSFVYDLLKSDGVNMNSKKDIEKGMINLRNRLVKEINEVSKNTNVLKESSLFILDGIKTLFNTALWVITKPIPFINKPFASNISYLKRINQRKLNRNILLSIALKNEYEAIDINEQTELYMKLNWDDVPNALFQFLRSQQEKLDKQIKSLRSIQNKGFSDLGDLYKLEQLYDNITDVLRKPEILKKSATKSYIKDLFKFSLDQLVDSETKINNLLDKLQNDPNFSIDNIDIRELMRIKSEILGSYKNIFSEFRNFHFDVIDGEDLKEHLENQLRIIYNRVQDNCSYAIHKTIEKYIDAYLENTSEKVIPKKQHDTFRRNMSLWLVNGINNGELNWLDNNVFSRAFSASPIVRMIHDRLTEEETLTRQQSLEYAAKFEALRNEYNNLIKRISPFNQMNRYAERTKNGFTGNFITDVKRGQYEEDLRKEKDRLRKKLGIRKEKGTWIYPEGAKLKYLIGIEQWMGGLDENNNVVCPPRVHKKYKAQYYIDRLSILGVDGYERLNHINTSIQELYSKCRRQITYTDSSGNKVTTFVPVTSELSNGEQQRLQQLIDQKNMLGSLFVYDIDYSTGEIKDIVEKQGYELELAKRFQEFNKKKQEYYKDSETVFNQELYDAVINQYDEELNNLPTGSEEYNRVLTRKNNFIKYNTNKVVNPEIMDYVNSPDVIEYDFSDPLTFRYAQLLRQRTIVKQHITQNDDVKTRDLRLISEKAFRKLKEIEQEILEIEASGKLKKTVHRSDGGGFNYGSLFKRTLVKINGEFATNVVKAPSESYTYKGKDGLNKYISLFYEHVPKPEAMMSNFGIDPSNLMKMLYINQPGNLFQSSTSNMINEEYDDSSDDYYQLSRHHYDNSKSKEYLRIKDDPVYLKLVELKQLGDNLYTGVNVGYKFKLPQMEGEASPTAFRLLLQGKIGQAIKYPFRFWSGLTNRITEADGSDVVYRPDGTVVETIPIRWVNKLQDPNLVDTDLVSSVIDYVNEALRYNHRVRLAPEMALFMYGLPEGSQKNAAQKDIEKFIYGRMNRGFGVNGRLSQKDQLAYQATLRIRQLTHQNLMGHSWRSVLKNGWDSFCNILQTFFVGKYVLNQNLFQAIKFVASNMFTVGFGANRSKAVNMTQALMQLNGISGSIHDKFKDQNKWWIRRTLNKLPTIEYEFVDYTAKAIITEAVYDTYRYVKNPLTGTYEFMNSQECENAYSVIPGTGREIGYKNWSKAKITLRDAYQYDKKTGLAELKDYFIPGHDISFRDAIRKKQKLGIDNGIGRTLENKVHNTILRLSETVNGMLESEDKNTMADNYLGALVTAFRGWMISIGGENYHSGTDFYTNSLDDLNVHILDQIVYSGLNIPNTKHRVNSKLQNSDQEFEGMYSFATGVVGNGLHQGFIKFLNTGLLKNMFILFRLMVDPQSIFRSKFYWKRQNDKLTTNDIFKLKSLAVNLDLLLITSVMTAAWTAYLSNLGGDDDDKWYHWLIESSLIASISERASQLIGFFPMNLLELVQSVTVSNRVQEKTSALLNVISDLYYLYNPDPEKENPWETEASGNYKGMMKADRDITEALTLISNTLGIDTTPFLLLLDAYNNQDTIPNILPDKLKEKEFYRYNANAHKSTSSEANKEAIKFYKKLSITEPIDWLSKTLFGANIIPEKEKNNKKKVKPKSSSAGKI